MRSTFVIASLLSSVLLLGVLSPAQTQDFLEPEPQILEALLEPTLIQVTVPDPDAAVWFEDSLTQQVGYERMFISPPLPVGSRYSYEIRAAWKAKGKQITRKKTVTFRPGEEVRVEFAEAERGAGKRVGKEGGRAPGRRVEVLPGRLSKEELQELAPGLGYLKARRHVKEPLDLLGGPVHVKAAQQGGDVRIVLPGFRELDMHVFGIPGLPRSWGGTPGINGVPLDWRTVSGRGDRYVRTAKKVPASNNWVKASDAKLTLQASDITATDAAVTKDKVKFEASWKGPDGNTYTVRCNKVVPHGVEYPVFGGVVTNHLMHGFTRIGTALMPTEFAYVAFWGEGETLKNGKVMEKPVMVHGMFTEKVRIEGYELAHDAQVIPTERHFHLMVPPFMPKKGKREFEHDPVNTGFMMKDDKELPFWHVMFEDVRIMTAHEREQPAAEREQSAADRKRGD